MKTINLVVIEQGYFQSIVSMPKTKENDEKMLKKFVDTCKQSEQFDKYITEGIKHRDFEDDGFLRVILSDGEMVEG